MAQKRCKCTRCIRRYRRICCRLFSPSFWNSQLRSRAHDCLGSFARKTVIFFYTLYEVLVCVALVAFYERYQAAAHLFPITTPGFTHEAEYLLVASALHIACSLSGLFAAACRRVGPMRFYFFSLPCTCLCTLYLVGPLLNMRCKCRSYDQCAALVEFNPVNMVNSFPSSYHNVFHDPPIACNPSKCPSGLTCRNSSKCCEQNDWDCCGAHSNRLYCPHGFFQCADGFCLDEKNLQKAFETDLWEAAGNR